MSEVTLSSIQATLARKSLAHFVKKSWPVLEPQTPLVWSWVMQEICEAVQALLEGKIPENNLLINVPPGCGKSRIVSVCTTPWMWLENPAWRAIYAAGNPRLSVRDSLYCRTLINSGWYRETFKPDWRISVDQDEKKLYTNTATGSRMALTAKQAVTGERGDALFWDDPLDAADANSRAERDAVANWYDLSFANRLNDLRTGKRCGIAQRLHEGDLSGHVIRGGQYVQLVVPQEYVPMRERPAAIEAPETTKAKARVWVKGWTDPREKADYAQDRGPTGGLLMDPIRFPPEVLQAEKIRLGSAGYAGQHGQNPAAAEGEMFKRRYWQYFKALKYGLDGIGIERTVAEIREFLGLTQAVVSADTALSENKSADFTCFCALGIAPRRFYVLDLWKERVEAPEAKRQLAIFSAKWGASAVVVEGGGSHGGKAIAQELRRDTRLPIQEIPPLTDKIAAANIVLPTVEAGAVVLPSDLPWVSDFVDSLAGFPRLIHDDDVDAFRLALAFAVTGTPAAALMEYLRAGGQAQQGAA